MSAMDSEQKDGFAVVPAAQADPLAELGDELGGAVQEMMDDWNELSEGGVFFSRSRGCYGVFGLWISAVKLERLKWWPILMRSATREEFEQGVTEWADEHFARVEFVDPYVYVYF